MKRYLMKVHGRVQGVGFRFHTQKHARQYGIKGWVKNNPDGTVEIDAEGEETNMERFIQSVKEGSLSSEVTEIEMDELEGNDRHSSFQIQY